MRLFLAKIPYTRGLPSQLVSLIRVEWTIWRANVLCRVWLSHYLHVDSALGIALTGKRAGLLCAALCPNCAAASPLAGRSLRVARRRPQGFRRFRQNRRTGSSALRRADLSRQCPGGASRLPSRQIGISFGRCRWRKCFIYSFHSVCWLLGRGKWLVTFLLIFVVLGPFGRTTLAMETKSGRNIPTWAAWMRSLSAA